MKKILITGIPGSGKSTISNVLKTKKYYVIDGLRKIGLAYWADRRTGKKTVYESSVNLDWFREHVWTWDESVLNKLLKENDRELVFVCGVVPLEPKIFEYFDKVFLLRITTVLIRQRIEQRTENEFSKNPHFVDWVLSWYDDFESRLLKYGAIPIDATKPVAEVVDEILSQKVH